MSEKNYCPICSGSKKQLIKCGPSWCNPLLTTCAPQEITTSLPCGCAARYHATCVREDYINMLANNKDKQMVQASLADRMDGSLCMVYKCRCCISAVDLPRSMTGSHYSYSTYIEYINHQKLKVFKTSLSRAFTLMFLLCNALYATLYYRDVRTNSIYNATYRGAYNVVTALNIFFEFIIWVDFRSYMWHDRGVFYSEIVSYDMVKVVKYATIYATVKSIVSAIHLWIPGINYTIYHAIFLNTAFNMGTNLFVGLIVYGAYRLFHYGYTRSRRHIRLFAASAALSLICIPCYIIACHYNWYHNVVPIENVLCARVNGTTSGSCTLDEAGYFIPFVLTSAGLIVQTIIVYTADDSQNISAVGYKKRNEPIVTSTSQNNWRYLTHIHPDDLRNHIIFMGTMLVCSIISPIMIHYVSYDTMPFRVRHFMFITVGIPLMGIFCAAIAVALVIFIVLGAGVMVYSIPKCIRGIPSYLNKCHETSSECDCFACCYDHAPIESITLHTGNLVSEVVKPSKIALPVESHV